MNFLYLICHDFRKIRECSTGRMNSIMWEEIGRKKPAEHCSYASRTGCKWLNQNFWQMYIWRRGPRRLEFLPPWATVFGEPPTDGSTGRWGQAPAVVATGGRIPSAVAHGGWVLALWPTAAGTLLYKGPSPYRQPLTPPSLLPPNLRFSTSSERFLGMFLNLVQLI
jgi:hypothetical protein